MNYLRFDFTFSKVSDELRQVEAQVNATNSLQNK
jgi:hypothetical protein